MDIIKIHESKEYFTLADKILIGMEHLPIIARIKKKLVNDDIKLCDVTNRWYINNYKAKVFLLELLYKSYNIKNIKLINNDINDYRESNILIEEKNILIPNCYNVLAEGTKVIISEGKCAKEERNMYWRVKDKNNDEYYLMHIKDNIFTKISIADIDKVLYFINKRPTWRLFQNGYICCGINIDSKQKIYYLHQYIMDVHDEDLTSFEKTVDHINNDKLDNRKENLRFANMSLQNKNRDKSTRRCDAKVELPEWLETLPKYVQYRQEIYDKENNKMRDFFVIDHPKLSGKVWESSKSMKIPLTEKFKSTKLKLELIDQVISEKQYNTETGLNNILDLPVGIRLCKNNKEKYQFIYDYRKDNFRYNVTKTLANKDIQNELNCLITTINSKYPDLCFQQYTIKNLNAISHIKKDIQ